MVNRLQPAAQVQGNPGVHRSTATGPMGWLRWSWENQQPMDFPGISHGFSARGDQKTPLLMTPKLEMLTSQSASHWELKRPRPSRPAQVINRPCQDGDVVQGHQKSRHNGS